MRVPYTVHTINSSGDWYYHYLVSPSAKLTAFTSRSAKHYDPDGLPSPVRCTMTNALLGHLKRPPSSHMP